MTRKRSHSEFENESMSANGSSANIPPSVDATIAPSKEDCDDTANPVSEAEIQDISTNRDGWQIVEYCSSTKKSKKKDNKKDYQKNNYPAIYHSPNSRLQSFVKTSDLQALFLYLLAGGTAPQWIAVRHHFEVRKVVVIMVPGLEAGMFDKTIPLSTQSKVICQELSGFSESQKNELNNTSKGPSDDRDYTQNSTHVAGPSPDDYYPTKLVYDQLPDALKPLAQIFPHIWPVQSPGDSRTSRMHSPVATMLMSPIPKSKEEKKIKGPKTPRAAKDWQDEPTAITAFLASSDELAENEYVRHPLRIPNSHEQQAEMRRRKEAKQTSEDGWVDSNVQSLVDGSALKAGIQKADLTAGREVIAMDCEMCLTGENVYELTRISLVGWDGTVLMDQLVKPDNEIVNYLTQKVFSGITAKMLENVTTRLADVQERLLKILTPNTVLVGHSLDSDLKALKMTHPYIVDTTVLYPHPRGPPLKSSLKFLAQRYLGREIQTGRGDQGHDSIEDAKACLDLARQKCEKGPKWGSSEASSESVFKRLARAPARSSSSRLDSEPIIGRTGAVVDWADDSRLFGVPVDLYFGCSSDAEIVKSVKAVVNGDDIADKTTNYSADGVDFTWARLRELEAYRGWWNRSDASNAQSHTADPVTVDSGTENTNAFNAQTSAEDTSKEVTKTVGYIKEIYESLPRYTAFIVYSGSGDPREYRRYLAMYQQYRKEFAVKNWNEISVQWTEKEQQAMKQAFAKARNGVGFMTVK
ncbi:MAG: hypothetical protein M1820_008533 [Bogoriella megaspora]|nr:MAG: hypothetical protein M1820_008533 [Bogoriella megaspora]